MTDSAAVVLADSVGRMTHSLDSLRDVVRVMAVQHDCWLHSLQGQTTLYLAITAILVAVVAALNWVVGREQIRATTKGEFLKLSANLEERASVLESDFARRSAGLRGDVFATVAMFAREGDHLIAAVNFGMKSAILALVDEQWTTALVRARDVEAILRGHGTEIALRVESVSDLREQLDGIERNDDAAEAVHLIERLLACFEGASVKPEPNKVASDTPTDEPRYKP